MNSIERARVCAIQIFNHHQNLELNNPKYYLHKGVSEVPPTGVIRPNTAEACVFLKRSNIPEGTSGILTYDIDYVRMGIGESDVSERKIHGYKLVLLWSVPLVGKNTQALGILSDAFELKTDAGLYFKLLNSTEGWYIRKQSDVNLKFIHDDIYELKVNIIASMSSTGKAIWTVNIR